MSDRYGFRVTLPAGWSGTDATIDWPGESLGGLGVAPLRQHHRPGPEPLLRGRRRTSTSGDGPGRVEGRDGSRHTSCLLSTPRRASRRRSAANRRWPGRTRAADGYDVNLLAALHEGRGYIMFLASKSANDDAEDRRIFEAIRSSLGFTR